MNATPAQLKEIIDLAQREWARIYHKLERYEMLLADHPGVAIVAEMNKDLLRLRKDLLEKSTKARKITEKFKSILAQDEEANFWKGEDRLVQFDI